MNSIDWQMFALLIKLRFKQTEVEIEKLICLSLRFFQSRNRDIESESKTVISDPVGWMGAVTPTFRVRKYPISKKVQQKHLTSKFLVEASPRFDVYCWICKEEIRGITKSITPKNSFFRNMNNICI